MKVHKKRETNLIREKAGKVKDVELIVKEFKLPEKFPQNVIEEAKKVSEEKVSPKGRRDFRMEKIFTIDGDDAKDLDDAVSVEKNLDNTYTLKVHIADVSHYVKEGSKLNKEAIARGTSVYLVNTVIPMLPKELSNNMCSLNEGKDRYALSVIMTINAKGEVVDSDICKSIIKVTKRMTYTNVAKIIDRSDKKILEKYNKYVKDFDLMKELAEILKARRLEKGYLSLDIPESKITLDKNGKAIDVCEYKTSFANEIIEQFMLTANETVAERFFWLNAPFIYRVHEKPEEEKVKELNKYLYNFGYKIKGKLADVQPKSFAQILEDVKGKEEESVVSNLVLRTLKVARYEAENKGHFGISSKYYCHFTSPIRRYPDLFIHRVISNYLEQRYNVAEEYKEKYRIKAEKLAEKSSEREQIATKAEREYDDIKKAEFMESKVGKEYKGVISGITSFGIFVRLSNTVEGLVRLVKVDDDYYIYNDVAKTLIGKETKKTYRLGQKVKIKVEHASKETGKVSFVLR